MKTSLCSLPLLVCSRNCVRVRAIGAARPVAIRAGGVIVWARPRRPSTFVRQRSSSTRGRLGFLVAPPSGPISARSTERLQRCTARHAKPAPRSIEHDTSAHRCAASGRRGGRAEDRRGARQRPCYARATEGAVVVARRAPLRRARRRIQSARAVREKSAAYVTASSSRPRVRASRCAWRSSPTAGVPVQQSRRTTAAGRPFRLSVLHRRRWKGGSGDHACRRPSARRARLTRTTSARLDGVTPRAAQEGRMAHRSRRAALGWRGSRRSRAAPSGLAVARTVEQQHARLNIGGVPSHLARGPRAFWNLRRLERGGARRALEQPNGLDGRGKSQSL